MQQAYTEKTQEVMQKEKEIAELLGRDFGKDKPIPKAKKST